MSFVSIFDGGRSVRIKVTLDNQATPAIDTSLAMGGSAPFTGGVNGHSYILSVDNFGNTKVVLATDNPEGPIVRIEFYPAEPLVQAQFDYLSIGTAGSTTVQQGQTYVDGVVTDPTYIHANTNMVPVPTSTYGAQINYFVGKTAGWMALALGPVVQPPPPVIAAPDESLTVLAGQAGIVTPIITSDGTPVAPGSLAIVTQPTHGAASVSGATLQHTPAAGYYGPDSFTYTATVGGLVSNVGTVTVTVAPIYKGIVYVYTLNGGKGKWSRYLFPFAVDAFAQLGNDLYIRHGDEVSVVSEDVATDDVNGVPTDFAGLVQWAWLDNGQPGVTKMLESLDYVGTGQGPSLSIGYDQRDAAAFTDPYLIDPDTLPGDPIPIPVAAPTFSIKLDFAGGAAWSVNAVTLHLSSMAGQP